MCVRVNRFYASDYGIVLSEYAMTTARHGGKVHRDLCQGVGVVQRRFDYVSYPSLNRRGTVF